MTPARFMTIQQALQPDWFQCLSDGDTIAGEVSKKRAKKSVDRSLAFLDECLQLREELPVRAKSVWANLATLSAELGKLLQSTKEKCLEHTAE